jgi:hypothetical protein
MSKELRLVRREPAQHISRLRFTPIDDSFITAVDSKLPRVSTPQVAVKRLVGIKARLEFMQEFRDLRRTMDINKFFQTEASPVQTYLSRLNHSLLLPEPMGLVKSSGQDLDLNASVYSMGDCYAEAIADGISVLDMERVTLRRNRLTDVGVRKVLGRLKANYLLELDLSYNYIGYSSIAKLTEVLQAHNAALRILRLEGLKLTDASLVILSGGLSNCDLLQELALARNSIGDLGAAALSTFVKNASALQKLDLHWNQIRGEGAKRLVRHLVECESLRVLDLSWNALASPSQANCAGNLSKLFKNHQKLYHVDLSHNLFSAADCKAIQQGLNANHTVMGLHLDGNDASIDSQGFVEERDDRHPGSGHIFVRILGSSQLREAAAWRQISNCWICERWSEIEFVWENGVSGSGDRDPIYLHLDIDDWRPDLMVRDSEGVFRVVRMCPPGPIQYFFTHDGAVKLAKDKPAKALPAPLTKSFVFYGTRAVGITVLEVNYLDNLVAPSLLDTAVMPRPLPKTYIPALKKREWSLSQSLFRDYKFDTEELLDKCFEFDWSCTRLPRIVKDSEELRLIKDYLKPAYKWM